MPRDALIHKALRRVNLISIHAERSRGRGLLGQAGLSGRRYARDALVAAVAMAQPRPVVLLTSVSNDMPRLTEEPGRPRRERIAVVHV